VETNITFASLLEPAGVVVAAGLITGFVQLIKTTFTVLDARVSGALMAFVLSAILYVLAAFATSVSTLDAGLVVFMAWLGCATSSVGIKSTVDHAQTQMGSGGG
jgi:predicted membrane protein